MKEKAKKGRARKGYIISFVKNEDELLAKINRALFTYTCSPNEETRMTLGLALDTLASECTHLKEYVTV